MSSSLPSPPGLRLFRVYAALAFAFAWVPVMYTAFVLERGFSASQYAQLWSVYYAAMVLAELPWGWVADRFGTRPLLVLGPLGLAASFGVLGHATDLTTCLLAMAATGASHAMISGADSAWLYDYLADRGRADLALHEEAAAHRWRLFGVSIADLLGGHVAFALGCVGAFHLSMGLMLAAAAVAACLPRPARHVAALPVRSALPAEGLADDLRRPGVLWSLLWFALVFVFIRVGFQLYQPTLIDHALDDVRRHGEVFSLLNLVAGGAAFLVPGVHRRLGERGSAGMVLILISVSFLGLSGGSAALLLPLLALQQVSFAFLQPLGRTALNTRIPSRRRAWMLSAQSVGGRLLFAVLLLLVDGDQAVADLPGSYRTLGWLAAGLAALLLATAPRSSAAQG